MRTKMEKLMVCVLALAVLLTAGIAQAADWTGAGADDQWSTTANWDTAPVADANVTQDFGDSIYDVGSLTVGDMILNSDELNNSNASMTIDTGSLTSTGFMQAGSKGTGTGTLNIGGDAVVTVTYSLLISNSVGSNGVLNMTSGTLNREINDSEETELWNCFGIGDNGTGTLNWSGGMITNHLPIPFPSTRIPAGTGVGIVNMSGGAWFPGNIIMTTGTGTINLSGGYIALNKLTINEAGTIDITDEGILYGNQVEVCNTEEEIDDAIAAGYITAYGGLGEIIKQQHTGGADYWQYEAVRGVGPQPEDGSTVLPSLNLLAWTLPDPNTPGDTVTCDVWFGTDPVAANNPLIVDGLSVESAAVTLDWNTDYYWQIKVYDSGLGTEPIIEITYSFDVYESACAYAQVQPGFEWDDSDINTDCKVDLLDFAELAFNWLDTNYSTE